MNIGVFTTVVITALAVGVLVVYPLVRLYFAEKEAHMKRVLKHLGDDNGEV